MDVYLIRHTPVDVPAGTCYGLTDVAVSADWREHAARVKCKIPLDRVAVDNVYTSPLSRCAMLSSVLSTSPLADDRLKEMNYGAWEGRLWSDIGRPQIDEWLANLEHYTTPNGESLGQVHRRGVDFIEELRRKPHDAAFVVTHGGLLRCVVAHVIGLDLAHAGRLNVDYASVTRITLDETGSRLESMNV